MPRRSPNLEIMVRAAVRAGRQLVRDFGEVEQLQVSLKGPADFVSVADQRAERAIVEELHKARPDYGFLVEESGEIKGASPHNRFIVDPLDGTTNFLHGIPQFAISIALEQHGEMTAAVIFDPIKDELFAADRGDGAFLNDRRIRVSQRRDLGSAVFGCGLHVQSWQGRERRFTKQKDHIADHVAGLRRFGAASLDLAWVAAGRQDGFWEFGLKPWDLAAGVLLVREAGGRVGHLETTDTLFDEATLIAANGLIYPRLKALLKEATPEYAGTP